MLHPSLRTLAYGSQLALLFCGGPLHYFTGVETAQQVTRFAPVGGALLISWVVVVLLIPRLRRVPPAFHFAAAMAWVGCGALILLNAL